MKRTLSYSLALVFALWAFSAPPAHAQIGTTCTITGTIYQVDGVTPAAGASLTVTRADKAGKLYANTSRVYSTNSNGIVSFKVPRTVGTDTAVIHVKASFGNLAAGQILYVPSDSTATLESLVRYTANPTFVVVAVPSGGGSGDTSLNGHPRLTRIENVEGQFTAGTSDSLQQAQADAKLALNIGQGKADADSMKLAFDRLGDRADADSLAGVKTTADGAFQRADTNALHAQKFAVINDSLFAVSLRATSTANDLTAHIGTADAHLPSQTGASGKFLQSNGTVSSWQTALTAETDPTVAARIKDSLALYNLGIMRGDSAALTKVLDMIYPRSGGSGGLTNWSDTDTSATQASRTLKPKAYTSNVNAVIRPLGTGAFILGPPPDGTAVGGNARGQNAVDLSQARTISSHVASGQYSAIVGGWACTASGANAVAGGSNATASGNRAVVIGGHASNATNTHSITLGVEYGTASGENSAAIGGYAASAVSYGSVALGGKFTHSNDSGQVSIGTYNDTLGVHLFTVGNGTGPADRRNAFAVHKDGSLQSTAYTRNIVTVGAGDSVVVSGLQNMLPTDAVTLAYQAGKTAHNAGETILSYAIYSATTITIYGVENRKVAWIRMR